jgi:hypothetical protein
MKKFNKGDRVRPSWTAIHHNVIKSPLQRGTVIGFSQDGCPRIKWDDRKTPMAYHYDFIIPIP